MKNYSKTLEGGGLKAKSSKRAFTLAETLITLAIIGVVAAITIPTLVGKYKKQELYTQFMKTYNTMSTALSLAVLKEGEAEDWDFDAEPSEVAEKYFLPFVSNYSIGDLDAYKDAVKAIKTLNNENDLIGYLENDPIILADGSYVFAVSADVDENEKASIGFLVDTNGTKGPNVLGRDLFVFEYGYDYPSQKSHVFSDIELYTPDEEFYNKPDSKCNVDGDDEQEGKTCPEKLIAEGKMNY